MSIQEVGAGDTRQKPIRLGGALGVGIARKPRDLDTLTNALLERLL